MKSTASQSKSYTTSGSSESSSSIVVKSKSKEYSTSESATKKFQSRRRSEQTKALLIGLLAWFFKATIHIEIPARGKNRKDGYINIFILKWSVTFDNMVKK